MYMKAKLENINGMKADILEIIQQYKLGHIPEEQTIKELCNLFSFRQTMKEGMLYKDKSLVIINIC